MQTNALAGQTAVITGGGSGIGAAIAQQLAGLGAFVILCGRSQSKLTAVKERVAKAGGSADIEICDVTDYKSVEKLAAATKQKRKKVDILVNNAGIGGATGPVHELDPAAWDEVLNTNLRGVFYCVRAFAPMMIEIGSGHIINISSLAGKNALPKMSVYAASKWGLNGFTYSIAEELRAHGIRVAAICPGSVNTEFSPHEGKAAKKMLQADDIAHAVIALVTQAPQSFISELLIRPAQKP